MKSESQRVEKGPSAQNALVPQHPHHIGQCIRWIGYHKDQRFGSGLVDPWNDLLKNRYIGFQQSESTEGIASVCRPASFLVHPGRYHHDGGASQIRIVTIAKSNRWKKNGTVLNICHDALTTFAVSVH